MSYSVCGFKNHSPEQYTEQAFYKQKYFNSIQKTSHWSIPEVFWSQKKKNPKTKIFVGNGKHTYFHILPSYLNANHELWLPKHQSLRKWTKWSTDPFWQHSVTSGQPQQWQGRPGNPPGLTQHSSSCAARTLLHALLAHEQSDSH